LSATITLFRGKGKDTNDFCSESCVDESNADWHDKEDKEHAFLFLPKIGLISFPGKVKEKGVRQQIANSLHDFALSCLSMFRLECETRVWLQSMGSVCFGHSLSLSLSLSIKDILVIDRRHQIAFIYSLLQFNPQNSNQWD